MQPEGISGALWVESRSDVIIPITFCRVRISAFHAVLVTSDTGLLSGPAEHFVTRDCRIDYKGTVLPPANTLRFRG
jgi:hypothetical protein